MGERGNGGDGASSVRHTPCRRSSHQEKKPHPHQVPTGLIVCLVQEAVEETEFRKKKEQLNQPTANAEYSNVYKQLLPVQCAYVCVCVPTPGVWTIETKVV